VEIEPGPFIVPMPTVLVGAMVDGKPNFMTAAFVGIVNFKPPIIACGLSPDHYTSKGIAETGFFSINLPHAGMVEATDWCGIFSGEKKDKGALFETFTGKTLQAPMISACRLTAECKVVKTVQFEIDTVYFGEIVGVHVDEAALVDGKPDWTAIAPLLFTFPDNGYWKLGEYVAKAWSVGKDFKAGEQ
jgi:flavin reductase (DIM6/NTAB) family NADH-FMN oxidoreductase RutF